MYFFDLNIEFFRHVSWSSDPKKAILKLRMLNFHDFYNLSYSFGRFIQQKDLVFLVNNMLRKPMKIENTFFDIAGVFWAFLATRSACYVRTVVTQLSVHTGLVGPAETALGVVPMRFIRSFPSRVRSFSVSFSVL